MIIVMKTMMMMTMMIITMMIMTMMAMIYYEIDTLGHDLPLPTHQCNFFVVGSPGGRINSTVATSMHITPQYKLFKRVLGSN
jgi:hypothetical protein